MRQERSMLARYVLLASLIAGCSAQPQNLALDRLISFDDAYNCHESAQFRELLESALVFEELPEPDDTNEIYRGRIGELAVPAEFRSRFGNPALKMNQSTYAAEIPVNGTWYGARLNLLVVVETIESEGGFYLVFDEPKQRVIQAANQAGLALPSSGTAYRDADAMGLTIEVSEYAGKTALSCFNV